MNPDPLPEYINFDYRTFIDAKEEALFKAYQKDLRHHYNRFNGTDGDGTYIILENQMKTWRLMNSYSAPTDSALEGIANHREAEDQFSKNNFLDPEFREDLYKKIFVYRWLKDLRENVYSSVPELEYKPPTGIMLPAPYEPKGRYDFIDR